MPSALLPRSRSVPRELRRAWERDGFVVIPQLVPVELLDEVQRDVAEFRATCGETKDAHGLGNWIGMLHLELGSCRRLAAIPTVLDFLAWAFHDKPLLFGSLNFDRGSERIPHIDTNFFHTRPVESMAGVWFALEDVDAAGGPLFYVAGSHRWPMASPADVLAASPDLAGRAQTARAGELSDAERGELVNALGERHSALLTEEIARRGEVPTAVLARRGDCVIWHPLLAHGGEGRESDDASRRSMVFHFIGLNARLYPFEEYFLSTETELEDSAGIRETIPTEREPGTGLEYMAHGYVATVVDGEQVNKMLG